MRFVFPVTILFGMFSAVGCGGDSGEEGGGSGDGDGNGLGNGDGDGDIVLGDGDGSGDGDSSGGDGDGGFDGCDEAFTVGDCSGLTYEAENIPLDIYIMFDQSASMGCEIDAEPPWQNYCCGDTCGPRIEPVRAAVDQFLTDPQSNGISVGIGFFGNLPIGSTSCDESDYAEPAVIMGELPGHATAVLDALYDVSPTGETPTGAAIRGACDYVTEWHEEHPVSKKVILLVTDGVPEAPSSPGCNPTVTDAAQAAEDCLSGQPAIPTYVLGVGQALNNLNEIAVAGGTEQAYLVDSDVEISVLEALNAIRSDAIIPCTLTIPKPAGGETINYSQVNVGICGAGGVTVHTYFVEEPAHCDSGGWYYQETPEGRVVQLCEQTCDTVGSAGTSLVLSVGCETVVGPVR